MMKKKKKKDGFAYSRLRNYYQVLLSLINGTVLLSARCRTVQAVPQGGQVTNATWFGVSHNGATQVWRSVSVHKDGEVMAAVVKGSTLDPNGGIWVSTNGGERWTITTAPKDKDWFGISIADNDPKYMIACAIREHLYRTTDGGLTWVTFTVEAVMKESTGNWPSWKGTALSADMQYQLVNSFSGHMFTSSDYGSTWAKAQLGTETNRLQDSDGNIVGNYTGGDIGPLNYYSCDMSIDGQYQTAAVSNGLIYVSNDFGQTFLPPFYDGNSTQNPVGNRVDSWQTVKMSDNGKYQLACVYLTGHMTISRDYGLTWAKVRSPTGIDALNYQYVAVSEDGQVMMAAVTNGYLLRSTDFGFTWNYLTEQGSGTWISIGMSNDGKNVLAAWKSNFLYIGYYKCVSGTYGTFPNCNSCPDGTCSSGGDGTVSSSCSASLCYELKTSSTNDILIRDDTEMTISLPEEVPLNNELRFELYSKDSTATEFISNTTDPSSALMSDSAASNYITFFPGEKTKSFKIRQLSDALGSIYIVFENVASGGTYRLPNRFAIYAPKTIQARKKKIFMPVFNNGTALDYISTYNFVARVESLPSKALIESGSGFQMDILATALIFRTSTGDSSIMLNQTSLETNLRVYGVEIGNQGYTVLMDPNSIWASEYESENEKKMTYTEVICGINWVPELEDVYSGAQTKKCVACPTGTVSALGAQSLLDCVCPAKTVDIRLKGVLPETYTVSVETYPCLSASLYCENRVFDESLGEYKQCVDFLEGKPVGISKDYYRFEFDGWQLVVPGEETSTLTLTDEHLSQLKPLVPVLDCNSVTCEYNVTGLKSSGCLDGSEGAMCAVCKADFFWHQDDSQCKKCSRNPDGYFSTEFLTVGFCLFAAVMLLAFLVVPIRDKLDEIELFRNRVRQEFRTRFGLFKNEVSTGKKQLQFLSDGPTLKERLAYAPQMPNTLRYRLGRKIYDFLNDFAPKMKLLVGFVQIIILWPETLYFIQWPSSLTDFVASLKIFSLSFEILPIDCVVQRDYYTNFFAATISPMVACATIMLCFGLASLFYSIKGNKDSSVRYIGYGAKTCILFLFIIYPSVSGMILQYFPCRDIGGGVNFLRFSIETSCDSQKYKDFAAVVYFMLVVYVVGIPIIFLTLMSSDSHSRYFRFLLKDYKPKYWYFEIIDMLRKLFLGAVIIFVGNGESDLQLYVIVFTTMVFLLVLGLLKPFTREDDNVLSQVINMELGFIALIAIAIKGGSESLGSAAIIDGLVLFAVVTVVSTCLGSALYFTLSKGKNRADFSKYDEDMSGDLDREELKMLLRDLGKIDTDEVCDDVFAKFDKEHHDSLDFDEFIEAGVFLHSLPSKNSRSFRKDRNTNTAAKNALNNSEEMLKNGSNNNKNNNNNAHKRYAFMRGLSRKFTVRSESFRL